MATFEIQTRWIAFPLRPDIPEEGIPIARIFEERGVDPEAIQKNLEKAAAAHGLPFGKRTMAYNTRRAAELGKWAEAQGRREAFDSAVFHALFVQLKNIALREVLCEVVRSVGLDPRAAMEILDSGTFREAVDRDWEYASRCGVQMAPTYLFGAARLVGAHPLHRLETWLKAALQRNPNSDSLSSRDPVNIPSNT